MITRLFLIFNHEFTDDQIADARASLGVGSILKLPDELQNLWANIPPDIPSINDWLSPLIEWLYSEADLGDYFLIQGDFGACYIMATWALSHELIPIYSTTERIAEESILDDGSVLNTHKFKHAIFRRYGN
jgi:hypothetical protein